MTPLFYRKEIDFPHVCWLLHVLKKQYIWKYTLQNRFAFVSLIVQLRRTLIEQAAGETANSVNFHKNVELRRVCDVLPRFKIAQKFVMEVSEQLFVHFPVITVLGEFITLTATAEIRNQPVYVKT